LNGRGGGRTRSVGTRRRFNIAIRDALIIEAARAAGRKRVPSEDLGAGQDFDGLTVEKPFNWPVPSECSLTGDALGAHIIAP
jgi:hypothetical protein